MSANYAALKAADAALPNDLTPAEAAALLNAPSIERARSFAWREARSVAQRYGRWGYILTRARKTPTVPIATQEDAAIMAAIAAAAMDPDQIIDPQDAAEWGAMTQGIAALLAAGDLTQDCADAILALGVETVSPASEIGWPVVSEHDVAHARGMA